MAHTREEQSHAQGASGRDTHAAELPPCPACGARARREGARYCATCGRHLRERDYRPADSLRASYRWPSVTRPPARGSQARPVASWRCRNEQTARGYVFLAYALIPVVGLAFCACALACCAAGLGQAVRARHEAAACEARRGLCYGVLVAGAQTLIWLVAFYLPMRMF